MAQVLHLLLDALYVRLRSIVVNLFDGFTLRMEVSDDDCEFSNVCSKQFRCFSSPKVQLITPDLI